MLSQNPDSIFAVSKDYSRSLMTPTLPGLQESPNEKESPVRRRNLKIITIKNKSLPSPEVKPSQSYNHVCYNPVVRRSLNPEFIKLLEPRSSLLPQIYSQEVDAKKPIRSSSISINEKGKHYLQEISTLNKKIRNLIKEQDSLRDKMLVHENIIMSLQKASPIKPISANHEAQSASLPLNGSLDESFFHITFKPQENWVPKSRKFPREVFGKISKAKLG